MSRFKHLISTSSIISVLVFSNTVFAASQPRKVGEDQNIEPKEFLLLLPSGTEKKDFPGFTSDFSFGTDYVALTKNSNPLVQQECLKTGDRRRILGGVAASLLGFLVKTFVESAFDAKDRKLQKKLAAYQASYDAKISIPTLSTNCVRFVRGKTTAKEIEVGLDMVIKLDPLDNYQMMQLRVLDIASNKEFAKAKGEDKVSFSVSAQFNGYYLDDNKVGQVIKYEEQVIHSGTFGKAPNLEECFVKDNKWDVCTPIFAFPGQVSNAGVSELTIKVSEVGTDKNKKQIENWKAFLGKLKGEASETLSGAVEELID